jgi:hypothetical protein
MPSKTSIGKPPGFFCVFSTSGGTALTSKAPLTRLVPSRPTQRATSPPPQEKPTSVTFFRFSVLSS